MKLFWRLTVTEMICIVCPRGCHLKVSKDNQVSGNFCKRGEVYALNEMTNPVRTVTSTVKVKGGNINLLPVVTKNPIPKDKIFLLMEEIKKVEVNAPIKIHDVIIKNALGLTDIIATRNILEKEGE